MLKFVILSMAVASALGASIPEGMQPQLDGRIVGGSATTITSYPWQVSIQRSGSHSCGGSIYSNNMIITAAHCLQGVTTSMLTVRVGSDYWNTGGAIHYVSAFKIHEGYSTNTMENDIAVVRLNSNMFYSSTIKNIALASIAPANNAAAVVTGWGTAAFGSNSLVSQLQYVNVNIVSPAVCGSSTYGYGNEIKKSMICAASTGKDACQGDSGGPLVSGGVLVGVVSWGYGCAFANYPGVYANVAELRSWIVNAAYNT